MVILAPHSTEVQYRLAAKALIFQQGSLYSFRFKVKSKCYITPTFRNTQNEGRKRIQQCGYTITIDQNEYI